MRARRSLRACTASVALLLPLPLVVVVVEAANGPRATAQPRSDDDDEASPERSTVLSRTRRS